MAERGNVEMQGFAGAGPVVADGTTVFGTDGDGSGASPRRSRSTSDRQFSLISSSFSSATYGSVLDDEDRLPPQSELEEIPSSRWLSPPPTLPPASSEVDLEELLARNGPLDTDMASESIPPITMPAAAPAEAPTPSDGRKTALRSTCILRYLFVALLLGGIFGVVWALVPPGTKKVSIAAGEDTASPVHYDPLDGNSTHGFALAVVASYGFEEFANAALPAFSQASKSNSTVTALEQWELELKQVWRRRSTEAGKLQRHDQCKMGAGECGLL